MRGEGEEQVSLFVSNISLDARPMDLPPAITPFPLVLTFPHLALQRCSTLKRQAPTSPSLEMTGHKTRNLSSLPQRRDGPTRSRSSPHHDMVHTPLAEDMSGGVVSIQRRPDRHLLQNLIIP